MDIAQHPPCDRPACPLISVIVASYNYAPYVAEAIRSVLAQSFGELEVLVVDDGSADGSLQIVRDLAAEDSRVRVFTHPDNANHGLPATLQRGLAEARGEFVAFLESDDMWHPQCLEQRLKALAETPEADVVFNAVAPLPMPGANTSWFDSYVPRIMEEHKKRGPHAFGLEIPLLAENKIPTFSCAMVRRARLLACSFNAPVPRWLDWWLWMQLAQDCLFRFVPEALTLWRLHPASYNHKIRFNNYMDDSRDLWAGFRKQFLAKYRQRKSPAALLLCLPHHARLALRFCMIAKYSSPLETIRRIRSRLK